MSASTKLNSTKTKKETKMAKEERKDSINRVTPYLTCINSFTGEGDTVEEYFSKLDDVGAYARWSDADFRFAVSVTLRGRALTYYDQNLRVLKLQTFEEVKDALIRRFREKEMCHAPTRKLLSAVQRPNESVREFASRVEALSFRTTPHSLKGKKEGEEARLELLCSVFLEGLRNPIKRLVLPHVPKSFSEAVDLATMEEDMYLGSSEEAEIRVAHNNGPQVSTDNITKLVEAQQGTLTQLTKMFENMQTQLNSLSQSRVQATPSPKVNNGRNSFPNPAKDKICWTCQKKGHVWRNCRSGPPPPMPFYPSVPSPNMNSGQGGVFVTPQGNPAPGGVFNPNQNAGPSGNFHPNPPSWYHPEN